MSYQTMEMIYTILPLGILHIILSGIFGELAGRAAASKFFWFLLCLFTGPIAIIVLIYTLWRNYSMLKAFQVVADLIKPNVNRDKDADSEIAVTPFSENVTGIAARTSGVIEPNYNSIDTNEGIDNMSPSRRLDFRDGVGFKASSDKEISVTPFEKQNESEISGEIDLDIFNEYRDNKIEDLINWGELGKAADRAQDCLDKATRAGDNNSVRLYKAYMALLGIKDLRA